MDYDLIVRGGMVIDGSGLPRRRIDIAVKDGRIAKMAHLDGATAAEEIDATGLFVAPGVVDAHTHYDPQMTFDPYATMSCFHGVTTVLAGNCGFSAAPVRQADQEFIKGVFARVEDMDPIALSAVAWGNCRSFADFMGSLKQRLGINFACYVGHSNIRRWVMGAASSERAATAAEISEMCAMVREAMAAGAAGFSTSLSPTHMDGQDRPVPSRMADDEEVLALAEEAGRFGAGSICFLPAGTTRGLTDVDHDFIIALGKRSGLPVVIQGLGAYSKIDVPGEGWAKAVEVLDRAEAEGAPFYSLLIARPFDRPVSFDETNHHWQAVPTWHAMTRMPIEQRRQLLRDPVAREAMRNAVENQNTDPAKGTTLPAPQWSMVFVAQSPSLGQALDKDRSITQLAADKGMAPGDYVLDLALADDFATQLRWSTGTDEYFKAVAKTQLDPRIIIGTSDGGAHLAKDDQADWSSYFLGTWVRDRKIWSLEEGIRQITAIPAAILGFHDRGTLRTGGWADMMIFDPATIGPLRKEFVRDLPGGVGRYKAFGTGVKATIVNGQPIVLDGKLTGRLPGHVVAPS